MMWLRINCVDFTAVILNMETKLNAQENLGLCAVTGTSVGCQSNEVRLQQQGLRVPGQQPWVQLLWRRGANTQSRALNKSLESGAFKHKL